MLVLLLFILFLCKHTFRSKRVFSLPFPVRWRAVYNLAQGMQMWYDIVYNLAQGMQMWYDIVLNN